MVRNSYNTRGSSMHAGHRNRYWHVFIVLVLALIIGSAGQVPVAHAAAPTARVRYLLIARKLKGGATVCVGDDVPINVHLIRSRVEGDQGDDVEDVSGMFVETSMSNAGIGSLNPNSMETGRGSFAPGEIDFVFHAAKEGSTTITFNATIRLTAAANVLFEILKVLNVIPKGTPSTLKVSANVDVKVEKCDYKVTTYSKWEFPGEAHVKIEAAITNCGMVNDGSGHYTGDCRVNWRVRSSKVQDCKAQEAISTSDGDLSANKNGDELTLQVTFQTANVSMGVNCVGSSGETIDESFKIPLTPDVEITTVPASGGSDRQDQILKGPETRSGPITIIVVRVKE
jgi:hypothetical protein